MLNRNTYLLAKAGDRDALLEVIKNYEGLIVKKCNYYKLRGYEMEDLKQIAYIAVIEACKKLSDNHLETAPAYIINSIRNALAYEARKTLKEPAFSSLNEYTDSGTELIELLEDDIDIEQDVLDGLDTARVLSALGQLTSQERDIISRYVVNQYGGLKEYSSQYQMDYRRVRYLKDNAVKKLKALAGK